MSILKVCLLKGIMTLHKARVLQVAFGTVVRQLRLARSESQDEFAHRTGLHRTYIGSLERGERNVSLANMDRIARALGVPIAQLLERAEKERDT